MGNQNNESTEYEYIAMENFRPVINEAGKQLTLTKAQASSKGYQHESRFGVMSKNDSSSIETYFNYYTLIIYSLKIVHQERAKYIGSKFVALLGAGYVPIFAPPTFGDYSDLEKIIRKVLTDSNVRFHPENQYAVDSNRRCNTNMYDLWASRIDLCEHLGIPLDRFDIFDYLKKEVLPLWM